MMMLQQQQRLQRLLLQQLVPLLTLPIYLYCFYKIFFFSKGALVLNMCFQVTSYQFSVSWARILPDGSGDVNQAGIDHYIALLDALLAANIKPVVVLYSSDLPQALEGRGHV